MTTCILVFVVGLSIGYAVPRIWSTAIELLDLYREQGR